MMIRVHLIFFYYSQLIKIVPIKKEISTRDAKLGMQRLMIRNWTIPGNI